MQLNALRELKLWRYFRFLGFKEEPLVCFKDLSAKSARKSLRRCQLRGVPVSEGADIFENCRGKGVGEMLDARYFRDFALALSGQ